MLWWAPNAAHDLGGLPSQGLQLSESCGSRFYAGIQVLLNPGFDSGTELDLSHYLFSCSACV